MNQTERPGIEWHRTGINELHSARRGCGRPTAPNDLEALIRAEFEANPAMSWDAVIADFAREKVKNAAEESQE